MNADLDHHRDSTRCSRLIAVILAVAHGSYVEGAWPLIERLLIGGSGLVLDIKMKLDRGSKPAGIELWRL